MSKYDKINEEEEVDFEIEEMEELEPLSYTPTKLDKKVLVTGGRGFLGSHICDVLVGLGAQVYKVDTGNYDLTDYEQTRAAFKTFKPHYVVHCAGFNGGIEFNRLHPAEIIDKNLRMALNVHKVAAEEGVERVLNIATSCAYPDFGEELFEYSFWDGLPNDSIRCHGLAKRMMQAIAEQYHKQYGLRANTVSITNLYGPRDTFNLQRTKVVGAVIRKVVEAHQGSEFKVSFWGDGSPLRQLMYVTDAAHAVVEALLKYDDPTEVLNIGCSYEVSIKELVDTVIEEVGYFGEAEWDKSKGNGQMRKYLNLEKMETLLDFEVTGFKEGIAKTVRWYLDHQQEANQGK